jgi:hypothetical protein
MQKISSVKGLKEAIRQLESDQEFKGRSLRNQFAIVKERLKPANLLKTALIEIVTSPVVAQIGIETVKSYGHLIIDRIFKKKQPESGQ